VALSLAGEGAFAVPAHPRLFRSLRRIWWSTCCGASDVRPPAPSGPCPPS